MSIKVLLIDDEEDIIDLLSYNFKKHGYLIETAMNGFDGFDKVIEFKPDIIISDILMPKMSGIKMCKALKEDAELKHIPIIFLSASNDDYLALSSLDAGGARYISKPIHIPLLLRLIKDELSSAVVKLNS